MSGNGEAPVCVWPCSIVCVCFASVQCVFRKQERDTAHAFHKLRRAGGQAAAIRAVRGAVVCGVYRVCERPVAKFVALPLLCCVLAGRVVCRLDVFVGREFLPPLRLLLLLLFVAYSVTATETWRYLIHSYD